MSESIPYPSTDIPNESKICKSCGTAEKELIGPNQLCSDCREKFIKFPIPFWIKAFGSVIGVLLLFSMITFPKTLSVGLHQLKGVKAENEKNFFTAQKEFEEVVKKEPSYTEGLAHLALAELYNNDYVSLASVIKELENKKIENTELYQTLEGNMNKATNYFPSDSFKVILSRYGNNEDSIPKLVCDNYLKSHKDELYPAMVRAKQEYDLKNYLACDSILTYLLRIQPDNIPALTLKTGLKREIIQLDSSLVYCDKILEINHQSLFGFSSKARTFLKQRKDTEALNLALKVYEMNKQNYYNTATLAITYHLTNKIKERDLLVKQTDSDSASFYYMQYAKDIISGKEKFRD